jgi:CIC family chloride channel protein
MKITNYFYAVSIFLTGILSGISVILFKHLLNFSQNLFFLGEITFKYAPNIDYNSKPLGALIIIIPVIGSVFVTYLIKNFASEAKGHGVPEVIFAIKYNKSFIRPIVALIKSIASAISIGTGGSSGMEGPVVQIASTLGSMQNIIFKNLTDLQKATLVACGASSGFAAAFNSPLSGILFSIELLLPIIALETIIPLMISTSIAVFISNYAFGNNPYFVIHHILPQGKISDLYEYILLGSFAGICAAFFIWSLDNIENYVEKLRFNGY